MRLYTKLTFKYLLLVCLLYAFGNAQAYQMLHANKPFVPMVTNDLFRDEVIRFVHGVALNQIENKPLDELKSIDKNWNNRYQTSNWTVQITLYCKGSQIGQGQDHDASLSQALTEATKKALNQSSSQPLSIDKLKQYRFKITFYYHPSQVYSFIEYEDKGLELTGSKVAVRTLSKNNVQEQVNNSQHYLLASLHPQLHGFFKFYNAATDTQETLLRTIYSASSLYSLIKLYQLKQNPELETHFKPIADFILSNQVTDGPNAGGFYYGYNPAKQKKTCIVVVGTTSKTIFTLLELHQFYPEEPKYLKAAVNAGNWLLTRVDGNGLVSPVASCATGKWINRSQQSFLYSGQVLSALSRLYKVTKDPRYLQGADKIAKHFLAEVESQGTMVGDDYRPANSISSSWVMMSLIDYAKVNTEAKYLTTIQNIAKTIISRQILNPGDIYNNGRYLDAMTASGNGWINEVMGVLYTFCKDKQLGSCEQYHQAILHSSRWLIQNAYSLQNTYNVKNPTRAIGGFMTNFTSNTVRTDAVCHGVNSLIMLLESLGTDEQVLLNLPERPLIEILPLIRAGNG